MRDPASFEKFVARFAERQSDSAAVARWVDRITERIFAEVPSIAEDAGLAQLVLATARLQWTAFLASLTQPEREVPMLPSAVETAVELARRGHSLKVLFRIYRIARRAVWDYITDVLPTVAAESDDSAFLIFFWNRASTWFDSVIEGSSELFEAERDRVRLGADARRLMVVRNMLDGTASADSRELSAMLGGHPLSGYNTGLLLHASDADQVADLRDAALELARLAGSRNPLLVSPGGRDLWAWLATKAAPDTAKFARIGASLSQRGVSVALGVPCEGIDGFRLSHLQAQRAQRLALAAHGLPNPIHFAAIETLAMLWQTGDEAPRFVQRVLGPLAKNTEAVSRLRETARVVLETGSVERAAQILVVHKNTIRYRMAQVEKHLGRPINEGPTDLGLALAYHEAFMASAP